MRRKLLLKALAFREALLHHAQERAVCLDPLSIPRHTQFSRPVWPLQQHRLIYNNAMFIVIDDVVHTTKILVSLF